MLLLFIYLLSNLVLKQENGSYESIETKVIIQLIQSHLEKYFKYGFGQSVLWAYNF